MRKEIVLTRHARLAKERRNIDRRWLKRTVDEPDDILPGKANFGAEVRRRRIDEADGKRLVVVLSPTRRKVLVITVYFEEPRP